MPLNPGQAPTHVPDFADQSKGGAQVTPLKVLANSTRSRKWCTMDCVFADMCPMLPLSMAKEYEVVLPTGLIKHPCMKRSAPQGVQRRIRNMFLNGEEGLLTEIKNNLFVAGTNLGGDVKERLAYSESLMKLHRTIYGEKSSMNTSEPIEITVRQLSKPDGMTGQEIKVMQQANATKLLESQRQKRYPDDPMDLDDESLLTSPVLDLILNKPKQDDDI